MLRIALLIESSRMYGRELLRGIAAYAHQAGPWLFFVEERALADPLPPMLKHWAPDGILVRLASDELLRQVRDLQLPTVDLYRDEEIFDIPGVTIDQRALVHQAIRHFQERGFQNYAYCGYPEVFFSENREAHFLAKLQEQGIRPHVFHHPPMKGGRRLAAIEAHATRFAAKLAEWLQGLPKPVALLACNDMRAFQILNVCNALGISVPEEVAILGVDNDPIQCELSHPTLSSIDPNAARIGYEGAALLHRLIQGDPKPSRRILIEPRGVAARRSTDVLAVGDPDASAAIRHVRQQALQRPSYAAILADLQLSRSTLERWFHQYLGHSVSDEIRSIRVKHLQQLLLSTTHPLETIAQLCGFPHVETMSRLFKRHVGMTPGEYRRQGKKL
ncbi:MAG: XylR family transcriptional regulator [Pirellulales bacterium]|nr:XylR family transcriptional regulator [Pirellulales bacterium]